MKKSALFHNLSSPTQSYKHKQIPQLEESHSRNFCDQAMEVFQRNRDADWCLRRKDLAYGHILAKLQKLRVNKSEYIQKRDDRMMKGEQKKEKRKYMLYVQSKNKQQKKVEIMLKMETIISKITRNTLSKTFEQIITFNNQQNYPQTQASLLDKFEVNHPDQYIIPSLFFLNLIIKIMLSKKFSAFSTILLNNKVQKYFTQVQKIERKHQLRLAWYQVKTQSWDRKNRQEFKNKIDSALEMPFTQDHTKFRDLLEFQTTKNLTAAHQLPKKENSMNSTNSLSLKKKEIIQLYNKKIESLHDQLNQAITKKYNAQFANESDQVSQLSFQNLSLTDPYLQLIGTRPHHQDNQCSFQELVRQYMEKCQEMQEKIDECREKCEQIVSQRNKSKRAPDSPDDLLVRAMLSLLTLS